MSWTEIITICVAFLGTLSGSGPWGIAAMALGGGTIAYLATRAIKSFNKSVDASDDARAGADAGQTAQDLKMQADANREWIEKKKKEFENDETKL